MAQTLAIITRKFGDRGGEPAKAPDCLNGRRFSDWPLILIDVQRKELSAGAISNRTWRMLQIILCR